MNLEKDFYLLEVEFSPASGRCWLCCKYGKKIQTWKVTFFVVDS